MDWSNIITSVLTSSAVIAMVTFLAKKWIGTHIEATVRLESDKKLEEHKTILHKEMLQFQQQMQTAQQHSETQIAADIKRFKDFLEDLPTKGAISYLRDTDMGMRGLNRDLLFKLYDFHDKWLAPELHFLDDEIEQKRKLLERKIEIFGDNFRKNTFPAEGNSKLSEISRTWPDKAFRKAQKELNSLADSVIEAHEDLIKTAQKKLNYS